MGLPMVGVLLDSGCELTVYDIDPASTESARQAGARVGVDAAQVAAASEVLCIMVATAAQLDAVLFGESGAAAALRPGSIVLIMATVGPSAMESVGERLARQGVGVVDAPVSGGVVRARTGELTFMLSGSADNLAAVSPFVAAMARSAFPFGHRPGDAQRAKLVNQLLCGVHIAVAAEALSFASALGLDPAQCWEALRTGAAASFMLEDRGARMLQPGDKVNSALSIFVKDMTLVTEAAQAVGISVPVAMVARQLYEQGAAAGLSARDDSSLIELWLGREAPA